MILLALIPHMALTSRSCRGTYAWGFFEYQYLLFWLLIFPLGVTVPYLREKQISSRNLLTADS